MVLEVKKDPRCIEDDLSWLEIDHVNGDRRWKVKTEQRVRAVE